MILHKLHNGVVTLSKYRKNHRLKMVLYRKQAVGKLKEASLGRISTAVYPKILKKQ